MRRAGFGNRNSNLVMPDSERAATVTANAPAIFTDAKWFSWYRRRLIFRSEVLQHHCCAFWGSYSDPQIRNPRTLVQAPGTRPPATRSGSFVRAAVKRPYIRNPAAALL